MEAVRQAETFLSLPQIKLKPEKVKSRFFDRSFSFFFKFLVFVSLLCALTILNLSQRALITENALTIEQLKQSLNQEKIIEERLLLKKASLEQPKRVEKIALTKLGMVKPTQVIYLTVPKKIAEETPFSGQNLASRKEESTATR